MNANYKIYECISGRIGRLNRITSNIYRKHLSSTGLTESQAMIALSLLELNSIEQIQLANNLALEKSSLSRNLVRLQNLEYIQKSEDYHPKISLTEKGRQFAQSLKPIWEQGMIEVAKIIGKDGAKALSLLESKF